jgi:hypothetical protein
MMNFCYKRTLYSPQQDSDCIPTTNIACDKSGERTKYDAGDVRILCRAAERSLGFQW